MIQIKIKKLRSDAFLPQRATSDSAGFDLRIPDEVLLTQKRVRIPLGLAMELPKGYCAKIRPRSGCSAQGLPGIYVTTEARFDADVSEGLIDADYRGEIALIVINRDERPIRLERGKRLAQMTIEKIPEVVLVEVDKFDEENTARGQGGFGHTGID